MKKKTLIILLVLTLCILCVIASFYFFRARPIIADVNENKIDMVIINIGDADLVQLKEYNEKEILDYLSTCKERRWIFAEEPHYMDDIEIQIMMHGNDAHMIILGNVNYTDAYGKKFKILNAEEVKATLKEMINFDAFIAQNKTGNSK